MKKTRILSKDVREKIKARLVYILERQKQAAFAYMHGSFISSREFRDVDIAVYVHSVSESNLLEYELHLESVCEEELRNAGISLPVDCRILNKAPLSFCYSVIKQGHLIYEADPKARALFEEKTYSLYLDFLPYRCQYMKEVYGLS